MDMTRFSWIQIFQTWISYIERILKGSTSIEWLIQLKISSWFVRSQGIWIKWMHNIWINKSNCVVHLTRFRFGDCWEDSKILFTRPQGYISQRNHFWHSDGHLKHKKLTSIHIRINHAINFTQVSMFYEALSSVVLLIYPLLFLCL